MFTVAQGTKDWTVVVNGWVQNYRGREVRQGTIATPLGAG